MPRGQRADFLQHFRFHAIARKAGGGDVDPLELYQESSQQTPKNIVGFEEATLPGYDVENVEYHSGLRNLPRKQLGKVSMSGEIELSRGILPDSTSFFGWIAQDYLQGEEYRADVFVYVWSQAEAPDTRPQYGATNQPNLSAARVYKFYDAIPTNQGQSDLSGDDSEIHTGTITIAPEAYEIDPHEPE